MIRVSFTLSLFHLSAIVLGLDCFQLREVFLLGHDPFFHEEFSNGLDLDQRSSLKETVSSGVSFSDKVQPFA